MTDKQPEALRLAAQMDAEQKRTVELDIMHFNAAQLLRTQHAAIERKDALLRQLIEGLRLDCHDVEDWPEYSRKAVEAITKELENTK